MKYSWLEKFAKEGKISDAALKNIYADVNQIIKEASSADTAQQTKNLLGDIGGLALFGLMTSAVQGPVDYLKHRFQDSDTAKLILKTKKSILSMPEFSKEKEKAEARFNEVVTLAPHAATNEGLMKKLISHKLHSGLTDSDVQSLSILQAHYMNSPERIQKIQKKLAEVRPEVVGNILADVHLLKTAALKEITKESSADRFVSPALSMGKRLRNFAYRVGVFSAPPLVVGAGFAATNALLRKRDEKQLEQSLDVAFRRAMSLSSADKEPLHENPEKARQAFNALARFAPQVALEPQAARAFMVKIVSYDQGVNISDIKDLSEIHKNLAGTTRPNPILEGFDSASKYVGAPGIFQNALQESSRSFELEGKDEWIDGNTGKLVYKEPLKKGSKN